ncbi:hypothetical protein RCC89_04560 [Cytophagaceae bacterium ABcell3]|nr:hypothetical protein RCC89_04560 [Cytophagaceae bacterium ABcell3]
MLKKYFLLSILACLLVSPVFSQARFDINSPISRDGIGQLHDNQPVRNIGMGGTGIANGHQDYINFQNPALLGTRRGLLRDRSTKYTKWEASLYNFNNQYRSPELDASGNTINFNQFSYLFPIGHRWATAISLNPFSHVNYNIHSTTSEGDANELQLNERGHGGLYQASFMNSFNLTRNFSAGFQTSYIFGRIRHERFVGSTSQAILDKFGTVENNHYRGFMFKPGLSYRGKIRYKSGEARDSIYFNMGVTYEFFSSINVQTETHMQTRSPLENIHSDSIIGTSTGIANFPSALRGGISFDKLGRWSVAADVAYTPWSEFFAPGQNGILTDQVKMSVGGEYYTTSRRGDLRNIPIRAGASYSRGHLEYNGTDLHDISLSLGTSIPVGRPDPVDKVRPLSQINLALVGGHRSTFAGDGLRERYVNLFAGILINDKWFKRRRIN